MAKHIIDQDQTSTFNIFTGGESWVLEKGVSIETEAKLGMFMSADSGNSIMTINGKIITTDEDADSGHFSALVSLGEDSQIRVGKSGALSGENGAQLSGSGQDFRNFGSVSASQYGLVAQGDDLDIFNVGTLSGGAGSAIQVTGSDSHITNAKQGVITGPLGIYIDTDDGEKTTIVNDGKIESTGNFEFAIYSLPADGSASIEIVRNSGRLDGGVMLGAGADIFDSRFGKITGPVLGGDGDDTYVVGKTAYGIGETATGGWDTIKAFNSYAMADGINVEWVVLQGNKDITLTGNGDDGFLNGNTGNNHISAGEGSDHLLGHTGNDMLTGGAGADIFHFQTGWDKDVITDFTNGIDMLQLGAWFEIDNFKDLSKHHLSVSGDDLVITSGDDRLTIRDMDKSDFDVGDVSFGILL